MRQARHLRPVRFLGIVLTASVLATVGVMWREMTTRGAPSSPTPRRGGVLTASVRSAPMSFNPLLSDARSEPVTLLTQATLVRINRATFDVEPWLAERWEVDPDGRTFTVHLRANNQWSDGVPLTADDVAFSLDAAYGLGDQSPAAAALTLNGRRIVTAIPDRYTVVLTYPVASGAGLRLLDRLPILPKHKLAAFLAGGTLAHAWGVTVAPAALVGAGPFLLRQYQPGAQLVFERNPHYWRRAADGTPLPFLNRIVMDVVPDHAAELVRLESGALDLPGEELRPEDYVPARRAEGRGTLAVIEAGVALDVDGLWFCQNAAVKRKDPRFRFLQEPAFRQALSHAVDRESFAEDVFSGAAVPVWGPITPGNRPWFSPDLPRYRYDLTKSRDLLSSIGLRDRDGNGVVEDDKRTEARFTVMTQAGIERDERAVSFVSRAAREVGIVLDVAPVDAQTLKTRLTTCDYDAVYFQRPVRDLDPAGDMAFWLSSGSEHLWNPNQSTPATEWERRIDALMREHVATSDPARRRALFVSVQRTFAENLPALYFAAPRRYYAHSARTAGVLPSASSPVSLWNADMLSITGLDSPGRGQ